MTGLLRLLLVDDDPVDRRLFEELLREADLKPCELVQAERVAVACRRLTESPFDLVLTDLALPDGFGRDTVEQLRAAAPAVPIVVLTGSEMPQLDLSFTGLGVAACLSKQALTPQLLSETLKQLRIG
jgi:CheY-like chemotaxis protein